MQETGGGDLPRWITFGSSGWTMYNERLVKINVCILRKIIWIEENFVYIWAVRLSKNKLNGKCIIKLKIGGKQVPFTYGGQGSK